MCIYVETIKNNPTLQERLTTKQRYITNLWNENNLDGIWSFIGVWLLIGTLKKLNILCTGHSNMFFAIPTSILSRLMRRDRFEHIQKMTHCSNPKNLHPNDS